MPFESHLVRAGMWDKTVATYLSGGEWQTGVTLAGSTGSDGSTTGSSASAVPVDKDVTVVSTTTSGSAGNAMILLGTRGGTNCIVQNSSANTMVVFAPVGGTMNGTTNAGNTFAGCVTIAAGKAGEFLSPDGVTWIGMKSA
jgi:hypothetical protein